MLSQPDTLMRPQVLDSWRSACAQVQSARALRSGKTNTNVSVPPRSTWRTLRIDRRQRIGIVGRLDWSQEIRGYFEDPKSVARTLRKPSMRLTTHLVCVVDDDESVRQSVPNLLRRLGFAIEVFSSAAEFLASHDAKRTECLLLDVIMPGMSGPELQRELKLRGLHIPIIFITGQTDATLCQRLLDEGAVDVLFKPFGQSALMNALNRVFEAS